MIGFDADSSADFIWRNVQLTLGQDDPNLPVPPDMLGRIQTIWECFADKAILYPRLQFWYTQRQVLDIILSGQWASVDWEQSGVSESGSQRFANLRTLRDDTQKEIMMLLAQAQASRVPAAGQLTATSPYGPVPSGCPDPNNPRYSGDPLRRGLPFRCRFFRYGDYDVY